MAMKPAKVYIDTLLLSAGNEYNNGVVISNRPLKDSELFEVRITDMNDKWTRSIEVGITALQPDIMVIPATMTNIQSHTWIMSECDIVSGEEIVKENYGISLDSLKVRAYVSCVCVCCVCVHVCVCVCVCMGAYEYDWLGYLAEYDWLCHLATFIII